MADVVVVGAGPTGLTLACGLLAGGVQVRVLDSAAGPAVTSRALGLQPRGAEVIHRLGALGDLPQRSVPVRQVITHVNGKLMARLDVGRRTKLVAEPGLLASQAEVEAGLRRRFRELGGRVEWGRELADTRQDADGVSLLLSDDRRMHTDWLVGCDGAHSRVRKSAGIGFPGVPVVERFLLADVVAELPLPRDAVSVWLCAEQMFGAFPLPGHDVWRLMTPAPSAGGTDRVHDDPLPTIIRLLEEHTGSPPSAVVDTLWTSTFRIHRRLASTYRNGRVLLAGDAAHIHSPFGGQGMNTGLGDAENLAWKLALVARGRADGRLLDTYQAERRPIAEEVLASTSMMTRMIVGDTKAARVLRDHVFVPLLNRPLVQRLIWEQASQLKIGYRHGPLARGALRPGGTPAPGERAPDLPCCRPDGSRTRLHTELGARWVLLVRPGVDAGRHAALARQRLGTNSVTLLVTEESLDHRIRLIRPDAHVAWRGSSPQSLNRWLTMLCGSGRS